MSSIPSYMGVVRNSDVLVRGEGVERKIREDFVRFVEEGIKAADPREAIKRVVKKDGSKLIVGDKIYNLSNYNRIFVYGCGKAGEDMAEEVNSILGGLITGGAVVVKQGTIRAPGRMVGNIKLYEGSHPQTTELTFNSTSKVLEEIKSNKLTEKDLVVYVVSGGGSAINESPLIPYEDYTAVNKLLVNANLNIKQINSVRKHLSGVKGGRTAEHLYPAEVVVLSLSDVIGDPPDAIASGPVSPDTTTFEDAVDACKKSGIWDKLPESARDHLVRGLDKQIPETPKPGSKYFDRVFYQIVASCKTSCWAVAKKAEEFGYKVNFVTDKIEDNVLDAVPYLIKNTKSGHLNIFGGEPVLHIPSDVKPGTGGRMLNLILRLAEYCSKNNAYILAFATDGQDGVSEAGAIVTPQTFSSGLNINTYITNFDDGTFFEKLGDLIVTGPTGTNVNNLILVYKPA